MKLQLMPMLAMLTFASVAVAAGTGADSVAKMTPKVMTKAPVTKAVPVSDKAIASIDAQIAANKVDKKIAGWKTSLKAPKVATFDPAHTYYARMITNKGMMLIQLKQIGRAHV